MKSKMKSKRIIALFICVLLILSVSSCGKAQNEQGGNETDPLDSITIGMSFDSFVIERWQRDRDVFVSTAKELGAEVNVQSANGEITEQIDQIDYFISREVDAIVIVTIDSDKLADAVIRARNAGIPVICYDRVVRNANADLYISFDNEKVGERMADAICGAVGDGGKVVEIKGPEADYNVTLVMSGFEKICEAHGMEIIASSNCDEWRAELAYNYVNENTELVSGADAIMCGNDSLAGETVHALAEMRLAGEKYVVGQDAELEACQRIVEGTQLMTVYKPVEKLAKLAAECAVKLAKGEKLEGTMTFNDGTYNIPYIAIDPIAVDKNNMDSTIIANGFHMYEDVYMNVPDTEPPAVTVTETE